MSHPILQAHLMQILSANCWNSDCSILCTKCVDSHKLLKALSANCWNWKIVSCVVRHIVSRMLQGGVCSLGNYQNCEVYSHCNLGLFSHSHRHISGSSGPSPSHLLGEYVSPTLPTVTSSSGSHILECRSRELKVLILHSIVLGISGNALQSKQKEL